MKRFVMISAILVAAGWASTSLASDCGVDCDTSGRMGRVFSSSPSFVANGVGSAKAVRVWVPLLVDADTSWQNNSVVTVVGGEIMGATSIYNPAFTSGQVDAVICFGTADQLDNVGGYTSTDIVIFEPGDYSDTVGRILADGTVVYRANFNSSASQNNLEWAACLPGQQTPIPEPAAGGKILVGPGIDGVAGSAFIGVPDALEGAAGHFWVGNSTFDSFTGNIPRGVCIWDYDPSGAALPAATPDYVYTQTAGETWAAANGAAVDPGDGRQTQPVLANVMGVNYVIFGINDTNAGGAARPALFCVDAFEDGDDYTGAVAIAPPAGFLFVDHQATGGGTGPFENSHFDINAFGQIAALTESTDPNNPSFQAVLYNPVFTAGRITGYDPAIILADAGAIDVVNDTLAGPLMDPNAPDPVINSISGVAINDRGNVAFSATYDTGIPFDPNDPNSLTIWSSGGFMYDSSNGSLHRVLSRNDVVGQAAFGEVAIGTIPQEDSDSYFGRSLADSADVMVFNFRVNFSPDLPGGARGVAVAVLGHIGDVNLDGLVDLGDLALTLASFGAAFGSPAYNPQADLNLDGTIDLGDLAIVLAAFGSSV